MNRLHWTLGLFAVLTLTSVAQESEPIATPFPPSTGLAQGLSPDGLARLGQLVQGFVDDGEIVGAELMVIKNGHSVLHEAYGWSDREAELPMQTGSVFCVRSMTKPLVAASILMLVDDHVLDLDDRVAEYLTSFDVEPSRDITIEQLLQHTSGLPMSLLLGKDLGELDGIQAVADLGAGRAPDFEPGSAFQYSDQGADTLTALLEVASGMPAAEFVQTRILDPMGMRSSAPVMTEGHPLRTRAVADYTGAPGSWIRFWGPESPPLFPFFLGSQGLYSSLEDYARFLDFWQQKGRVDRERLLGARFVRKALTPGPYPIGASTGFPGLSSYYGYLMQLWMAPGPEDKPDDRELVAFGHTGSDGTHAWVFPKEKTIVLYFTQSRGTTTGLRIESALAELFLGEPFDPIQAAPPLEEYVGYYWEDESDLYRAVVVDDGGLALDISGRAVVPLVYRGDDQWSPKTNPGEVIAFDRAESGEVTGYHVGEHREYRFEPATDLPSAEELVARIGQAHRLDLLAELGPLRLRGTVTLENFGLEGEVTTLLAWPDHFRVDSQVGDQFERSAYDGKRLTSATSAAPTKVLEGQQAALLRLDNPFARFGDLESWHPRLEVVQRLQGDQGPVLLLRTGDATAQASTLFVEEGSGRVLMVDSMTFVEGMGRLGIHTTFGDFREVSGMLLPFRQEVLFANKLIGTSLVAYRGFELGVELEPGIFDLLE